MRKYVAVDLGAESGRVIVGDVRTVEDIHRFPNGPVRIGNSIYWDFLSIPFLSSIIFLTVILINHGVLVAKSLKLIKAASTDKVTGLPTHRYFLLKLNNNYWILAFAGMTA